MTRAEIEKEYVENGIIRTLTLIVYTDVNDSDHSELPELPNLKNVTIWCDTTKASCA